MIEERKILQKYGKKNPFIVPESYFTNLTERIMDNLPQQEKSFVANEKAKSKHLFWLGWCSVAAACIACIMFYIQLNDTNNATALQVADVFDIYTDEYDDYDYEYQEDVINYTMLDNEDIYCYLSGAGF